MRKRWICGNPITRTLDADEVLIAFDEAMSAWRFIRSDAGSKKGDARKVRWAGPQAVHVKDARDAQRATRAAMVLLDNGTTSFRCSTRYGDEWYFLSTEILPDMPASLPLHVPAIHPPSKPLSSRSHP